jgi:hypothetical protein
MDWIDLTQDNDQWRALVNTIMNLRVPYNVGLLKKGSGPWSSLVNGRDSSSLYEEIFIIFLQYYF